MIGRFPCLLLVVAALVSCLATAAAAQTIYACVHRTSGRTSFHYSPPPDPEACKPFAEVHWKMPREVTPSPAADAEAPALQPPPARVLPEARPTPAGPPSAERRRSPPMSATLKAPRQAHPDDTKQSQR